MATITNTIRWATNSDQLAANLREGLNQIEATRASAEKLVQTLSGDKLIAAANKYTAAVLQMSSAAGTMDGAEKLSAGEKERINALLDKAIQKYQLLGQTAPSAMQQLFAATKPVAGATDNVSSAHSKLGEVLRLNIPLVQGISARFTENIAALGILGGAIAGVVVGYELLKHAVDFSLEVGNQAKALQNLATETGIGVERLQTLGVATRDYGLTTEELGRGIFQLSRRIAGDDSSASAALAVMGVNIQDLKKLAPDELFLTIVRAVNQIPDPLLRARVAADLFGSRMGAAFLAIGPGLDALIEKAKTSSEVMSGQAVKSAATFSDQIDHLGHRLNVYVGEAVAPALDKTSELIELFRTMPAPPAWLENFVSNFAGGVARNVVPFGGMVGDVASTVLSYAISKPPMSAADLTALGSMPLAVSHGAPAVAASTEDASAALAMANSLAVLRKQIVPLTDEQNAWLRSIVAIGPEFLTAANLLGTGITPQQLTTWKDGLALQQQLIQARVQAAHDTAAADAMETGGLQNAISTRIEALDAEHQARVQQIGLEVESEQKKHVSLLAENLTYQAKRRLIEAEGAAAVAEVERASAQQIAQIASQNRTKTLADRLSSIDDEVADEQQAALKRIGYTDDEWKAEYAIYLAGEARKQNLIDEYNKKEIDAETKLGTEIAGLQDAENTAGLARTLAGIAKNRQAEIDGLNALNLEKEDYLKRAALIDEKYALEARNATLDNERTIQKELLKVRQDTEDATANLLLVGADAELAVNENKRQRRLEQLRLEGHDTQEAINAENALYDVQAKLIISKYDPIFQAWKNLNTDMRQTWANTWEEALNGQKSFTDALLAPFTEMENRWRKVLAAMVADWEQQLLAKLGFNFPSGSSIGLLGGTAGAAGAPRPSGFGGVIPPRSSPGTPGTIYYDEATGQMVQVPPTYQVAEPGPGFGTAAGMGLAGGIAAGTSGGSVGSQIGQIGLAAAGSAVAGGTAAAVAGTSVAAGSIAAGAATMGIGLAVIAAIYYIKSTLADKGRDVMQDIGKNFGVQISQGLQDQLKKDVEEGGWTEQAAEIAHLSDIIKEAGGLTAANLPIMTARLRDAFSMVETKQMSVAQATKVLDDNWAAFEKAGTDATGRISAGLKDIIALNDRFGTQSTAIADFMARQATTAAAGFNAVAAGMLDINGNLKVWDDARTKIDSGTASAQDLATAQQAIRDGAASASGGLADLGVQAVATFEAARAAGKSEADALASIHPALQLLQKAYTDLGLPIDDVALKTLLFRDQLTTAAPQLMSAISGLSAEFIALDNMGLMNANTFAAMERSGQSLFERLHDNVQQLLGPMASLDDVNRQTLTEMQDYLHKAADEARALGVPLDDNTQSMIDQSKALGIWNENAEKVTDPLQKIADILDDVDRALRGLPPRVDINVNTDYTTTGAPPDLTKKIDTTVTTTFDQQGSAYTPQEQRASDNFAASGGYVGKGRILPFARGGVVPEYFAIGGFSSHARGSDTVPAMLTPGELIVNAMQQSRLADLIHAGASMASEMTKAPNLQPLVIQEHNTFDFSGLSVIDSTDLDEFIEKKAMPRILNELEDRRRGYAGRLARVVSDING